MLSVFDWFVKAFKWVVFIDNAETGLPWQAEIVVKSVIETIIAGIAACLGVSRKNPLVSIVAIIVGFAACIGFYFIAKHWPWILGALALLLIATIVYFAMKSRLSNKKKEEA